MIPTDARFELYRLQNDCARAGLSYADVIWGMRGPVSEPKSTGAWPFQPVTAQTNITVLRKGKKP